MKLSRPHSALLTQPQRENASFPRQDATFKSLSGGRLMQVLIEPNFLTFLDLGLPTRGTRANELNSVKMRCFTLMSRTSLLPVSRRGHTLMSRTSLLPVSRVSRRCHTLMSRTYLLPVSRRGHTLMSRTSLLPVSRRGHGCLEHPSYPSHASHAAVTL